jgi:SAM-dependent methyltransferase
VPAHYGPDLAYIHDVGHGEFALQAAPALLAMLREHGITRGRVVDLGCGSGLWAAELERAGYDVVGIDSSRPMIELARKRAPRARFVHRSFHSARLPDCDAVTSLGECLSYQFDGETDEQAVFRLFGRVHEALAPGGVFIFDLLTTRRSGNHEPPLGHRQGSDWAVLVRREHSADGRQLTRHITAFRKVGSLYRRSEEVHRLRLYDTAEVAEQLRCVGFRVRTLKGYGAVRFKPGHAGFLARKD